MKHVVKFFLSSLLLVAPLFLNAAIKILTPEEAFKVSSVQNTQDVVISIALGEGIYLYDDKLKLELTQPKSLNLDSLVERPKPEAFHEFITQRKSFEMIIPQSLLDEYVQNGSFTLKLSYQGCSELGLCYQPMENSFSFGGNLIIPL